jgi:membrane-associated phospholipid phosphatase
VAQRAAPGWPGERQSDFAAGEAIGRTVGAAIIAEARADNFGATSPGTPPVGPQYWYSSGAPIVRGGYGARTFHLTHDGELLWAPPPAFGSAEYLAGLAEVRRISDTRTAEQDAIARKWVPFSDVVFNGIATNLIVKYHRTEIDAARILAYANTAAFDAIAACFYTKFQYWYVRPSQADPAIKPPAGLGLPNHPSYPSAHSCESGAFEGVLSDAFPSEREALAATAAEANNSRIYAGFHYRFDGNAGLELGRAAARIALERQSLEPR